MMQNKNDLLHSYYCMKKINFKTYKQITVYIYIYISPLNGLKAHVARGSGYPQIQFGLSCSQQMYHFPINTCWIKISRQLSIQYHEDKQRAFIVTISDAMKH